LSIALRINSSLRMRATSATFLGLPALIRELREEVGVTPTEWRPLSEFREALPGGDGPIVLHLYAVTSWTGMPRNRSPREHSEISWFSVEDACRLALAHPAYRKILRTAVSLATGTAGEKPA